MARKAPYSHHPLSPRDGPGILRRKGKTARSHTRNSSDSNWRSGQQNPSGSIVLFGALRTFVSTLESQLPPGDSHFDSFAATGEDSSCPRATKADKVRAGNLEKINDGSLNLLGERRDPGSERSSRATCLLPSSNPPRTSEVY